MHAHVSVEPAGRLRVLALWLLLTVATVGFALLVAGFVNPDSRWTPLGTAALGFGVLAFVFVQFWATVVRRSPGSAAASVPSPATRSNIDFSYTDAPAALPANSAQPKHRLPASASNANGAHADPGGEPLVEFELVTPPQAPTRLAVPSAFEIHQSLEAAPEEPEAPWRAGRARTPSQPRLDYIPAVERRQEIVSGLPLISSILTEEPPAAVEVRGDRPGKTRGQCSSCGTLLWAPKQRPLRLRCPKCGHVRTLTS